MALPVGIQLYSLRDDLEKDFKGTLKAVKEMGYDGVEFAGLNGNAPEDVKAMCEEIGLVPISAHIPIDDFIKDGIENVLDTWHTVGVKFVVFPYLLKNRWPGGTDWDETYAAIKQIGEGAIARGMQLLYHNHDFEFKNSYNGQRIMDALYGSFSPEVLASELDVCWVNIGGENPPAYIKSFTGRAPVVHLKDFNIEGKCPKRLYALIGINDEEVEPDPDEGKFEFRPVGHGMQDMPPILAASIEAGAGWVIVEQDNPSEGTTPIECATKSISYLKGFEW